MSDWITIINLEGLKGANACNNHAINDVGEFKWRSLHRVRDSLYSHTFEEHFERLLKVQVTYETLETYPRARKKAV